ncbi:peptide chain release factor 1 [bacterium]|nr:peptide chain release factor 1 [bacterium]MBU1599358.1 peptide chain release factor 1 [bacterium]
MEEKIEKRLSEMDIEYNQIMERLSDLATASDQTLCQTLGKRLGELKPYVEPFILYKKLHAEIAEWKGLIKEEPENKGVLEELEAISKKKEDLENKIQGLFTEKEGLESLIMEIRAGTGGEESGLFTADLFRMYSKYCLENGFKQEIINANPTGIGGFKEMIFSIKGIGVYQRLRFELGVHRVQRVPVTEASGRVHTSAVTVAVLFEPATLEGIEIRQEDIRVDTFRSSGAGGQHVNKTESAIRITHIPTGLVVSCQNERSQGQNKETAMRVLKARLYEKKKKEEEEKRAAERKEQIKTGDRSEKIRTYNFKENRVTDHRIGLTLYRLDAIMDGDLSLLIDKLKEELS